MRSIIVIKITEKVGSFVKIHKKIAANAEASEIQSNLLNFFSPLNNAKIKIIKQAMEVSPITHDPDPPFLINDAKKAIPTDILQISHEKA